MGRSWMCWAWMFVLGSLRGFRPFKSSIGHFDAIKSEMYIFNSTAVERVLQAPI